MGDENSNKKMRKALKRLIAEVAASERIPADSEQAARLTFFLAAGHYQGTTKKDIVEDLRQEVAHVVAAIKAAQPQPAKAANG